MMQFDRISLGRQAKELGFVRDTFEKVCRLEDVLSFVENDALLSDTLALKGGTDHSIDDIVPEGLVQVETYGRNGKTFEQLLAKVLDFFDWRDHNIVETYGRNVLNSDCGGSYDY